MLKIVLDTNIIISAIVFGAKPRLILNLILSKRAKGYISSFIITETGNVLREKFKFSEEKVEQVEALLKTGFTIIEPNFSIKIITACPADNKILACAVGAKADYMISGDKKHILLLKKIKNILILSPEQFLKLFSLQGWTL